MYKSVTYLYFLVLHLTISNCEDIYDKCGDSSSCVEKKLVHYVDELENGSDFGDFVVIAKVKELTKKKKKPEGFVERCIRFLKEHEVRIGIPDSEARSLQIDGRSSKIKKLILPILFLLKLKGAVIVSLVLAVIGFAAFNGLGAGLTALAIAAATGLKSLLDGQHHNVAYEIPAPWSRAGFEQSIPISPLSMGYHTIPRS